MMLKNNISEETERLVNSLPKPETIEEQSMYAIICYLAGKEHKEPFSKPVKRKDQYWRALYLLIKELLGGR